MRGASLGGKVIAKHLATHLGLHASKGATFFAADEQATTWTQWMQHAGTLVNRAEEIDQAVVAASTTFEFLLQRFSSHSQHSSADVKAWARIDGIS